MEEVRGRYEGPKRPRMEGGPGVDKRGVGRPPRGDREAHGHGEGVVGRGRRKRSQWDGGKWSWRHETTVWDDEGGPGGQDMRGLTLLSAREHCGGRENWGVRERWARTAWGYARVEGDLEGVRERRGRTGEVVGRQQSA